MNKLKNIIFLGAGASAADGAPIQANLFLEYFCARPKDLEETDRALGEFFERFYGIDVSKVKKDTSFPTFEEVLGILELALARGEAFKGFGGVREPQKLASVREDLIFLIGKILQKKLDPDNIGKTGDHILKLVNKVKSEKVEADNETLFISLNYDLLIDSALMQSGWRPDYGISFSNPANHNQRSMSLYKLHGSLNWLRCPACSSITYTGDVKAASYPVTTRPHCAAGTCGSDTTPIVIPPSFFKIMSDFHLQQVWHLAELALTACNRIFFCGYSLPDADVHIKYLLKRAEINAERTPDVFVINHYAGKAPEAAKEEETRYKRAFREPTRVTWTSFSFKDFAELGFEITDTS